MKTSSIILRALVAAVFVAGFCSVAKANVWINEDFDADVAAVWSQGNGKIADPGTGTVDYFDNDGTVAIPTLPLITRTGTVVTTKAYNGTSSYRLAAGQTISVSDGYDGQSHGSTVYHQFALNVDPIPAAAGPIARFEYNTTLASIPFRFFMDVAADGAGKVNITGGQDLATTWTQTLPVATLNSNTEWVYLTVQLCNDPGGATDPRSPISPLTPSCHFYASSLTPAATVTIPGGTAKDAGPWSITVNGATTAVVFIDDLYWEAAMEGNDQRPSSNLQPFNKVYPPARVSDWELYL